MEGPVKHSKVTIQKMYGIIWLKNDHFPQTLSQHLSTRKVLSDGGDEVLYQRFGLRFDIDGASSIQSFK